MMQVLLDNIHHNMSSKLKMNSFVVDDKQCIDDASFVFGAFKNSFAVNLWDFLPTI